MIFWVLIPPSSPFLLSPFSISISHHPVDLSALKAGALSIHPRPASLQRAVSEVLYLSAPLVKDKDVKVIDNTKNLPQMTVDEARIVQVRDL